LIDVEDRRKFAADFAEHSQRLRLARYACIQARILNRSRDARSHERENAVVLFVEVTQLACLDVDHADDALLRNQRHSKLGTDYGIGVNVAWLVAHVVDQDWTTLFYGHSRNALAHTNLHALDFGSVANLEPHAQLVGALIEQQDGEDLVIDHLPHQLGNPTQELVHFERAVKRIGNIDEEILQLHGYRSCVLDRWRSLQRFGKRRFLLERRAIVGSRTCLIGASLACRILCAGRTHDLFSMIAVDVSGVAEAAANCVLARVSGARVRNRPGNQR